MLWARRGLTNESYPRPTPGEVKDSGRRACRKPSVMTPRSESAQEGAQCSRVSKPRDKVLVPNPVLDLSWRGVGWAVWDFLIDSFLWIGVSDREDRMATRRQLWPEPCQPWGPWRGALEVAPCDVLANGPEENVPVKSATPQVTSDLSERWDVTHRDKRREVFGAACVGREGANEVSGGGGTPVMHPGRSRGELSGSTQARASEGRAVSGARQPSRGLNLRLPSRGCRPGPGGARYPRALWSPAGRGSLLGAPLPPPHSLERRVSLRRGDHHLEASWHPFSPSSHASLSVRPRSASGPALTARR